jgi:ADP-heptose:LPS heptosyltransferase
LLIASGSSRPGRPLALLLNVLRRGFPAVQLDVIVRHRAAAAQASDGYAIMTPTGQSEEPLAASREAMSLIQAIRSVRSRRYDVAIDLTHDFVSAVLTRATGAGARIGYRTASTVVKWLKRITCYTQMIMTSPEHRHTAHQYLLVAEALGLEGLPPERFEPLPPVGPYAAVSHPAGGH